jgi:hypothetical protein
MDGMAQGSLISTVATLACWTMAGGFLGLVIASAVLSQFKGGGPFMCGNSVLEPGVGYGAILGFLGGCFVAVTRRRLA